MHAYCAASRAARRGPPSGQVEAAAMSTNPVAQALVNLRVEVGVHRAPSRPRRPNVPPPGRARRRAAPLGTPCRPQRAYYPMHGTREEAGRGEAKVKSRSRLPSWASLHPT